MDMEVSSDHLSPNKGSQAQLRQQDHKLLSRPITANGVSAAQDKDDGSSNDESDGIGKLKRSCSAPMINQLLPQARISAPPTPQR